MTSQSLRGAIAASITAFVAACLWAASPAVAQVVTGTLGSPSATTTIPGNQIPAPEPKFGGTITEDATHLQAVVAAHHRAAQGRAEHPADHDRRPGLRRQRHLRRRRADAGAGPHRQDRPALHAVPFDLAVLAHACGGDHRTQPPLRRLRRDHRAVHRLPRLRLDHRPRQRHDRPRAQGQRLSPPRGSARTTTRRPSSTARPAPSTNGRRAWASTTSTASWAARPTSGQPYLFQNNRQIFPWIGKPGYNLITDMADEAIKYMKELQASAPEQPFFLYYVPGGTHSPHQPKQESDRQVQGQVRHGLECAARARSSPTRSAWA